ncbi:MULTISPECIES: CHC2 zinc finger domain-containing protein [Amycolatopsis]
MLGRCPFYRSQAFCVRPAHGTYRCSRCGDAGDATRFRRRISATG